MLRNYREWVARPGITFFSWLGMGTVRYIYQIAASPRRTAIHLAILLVVLLVVRVNQHLFIETDDLPDLDPLVNFRPTQIGYLYDADGEVVMRMATVYRDPVEFDAFPPMLQAALLSGEDKRFFSRLHPGVDPLALPRVVWAFLTGGKRQGGSTLTQQLVRTVFLEEVLADERSGALVEQSMIGRIMKPILGPRNANTLVRKLMEIRTALHIERTLIAHFTAQGMDRTKAQHAAKEHVLMCYANAIYLGNGVYGFSYGARFYFGKSLADLEPHEAALLVSFIPYPGPYSRLATDPADIAAKEERRNLVLERMRHNGILTAEEYAHYRRVPVSLRSPEPGSKTRAPAIVNMALREVKELGVPHERILSGFAHPHLTVDLDIQDAVNRAVDAGMEHFRTHWPEADEPQAAVVVLRNGDAAVLGLYGGRYDDTLHNYSLFNRATASLRQPGSTFKGIAALAALRSGYALSDEFLDAPLCVSLGWGRGRHCISNYDGQYKGMVPLREVIAQSRNVPTVRMAREIGIEPIIEAARILGITTPLDSYPTTALGANSVTPLELANAYRAIATGISATPFIVDRITDEQATILVHRRPHRRVIDVRVEQLRALQELLRGTIRLPNGTGRSLDTSTFGIPVAGKTGTSNEHRDAWFVAFTYGEKGITVLAWVGYDDYAQSLPHDRWPRATGGSVALPIVREVFQHIYGEGMPLGHPPRFPSPLEQNIDDYLFEEYPERFGPK